MCAGRKCICLWFYLLLIIQFKIFEATIVAEAALTNDADGKVK